MEKIEALRLKMQNGGFDLTYQDMKVAIDSFVALRRIKMALDVKPKETALNMISDIIEDFIKKASL